MNALDIHLLIESGRVSLIVGERKSEIGTRVVEQIVSVLQIDGAVPEKLTIFEFGKEVGFFGLLIRECFGSVELRFRRSAHKRILEETKQKIQQLTSFVLFVHALQLVQGSKSTSSLGRTVETARRHWD